MLNGKGTRHFAELATTVRNAGCCAMSRRFMADIIRKMEKSLAAKKPLIVD